MFRSRLTCAGSAGELAVGCEGYAPPGWDMVLRRWRGLTTWTDLSVRDRILAQSRVRDCVGIGLQALGGDARPCGLF